MDPPIPDNGYYLRAAKALSTAKAQFDREQHPQRPYNAAILPASSDRWFVYFMPAQTQNNRYPLGADVRFLISRDATQIEERRQMHKMILEFELTPNTAGGYHTHVLSEIPEDSDVFYVLSRRPAVTESISAGNTRFLILQDGTIMCITGKEKKTK